MRSANSAQPDDASIRPEGPLSPGIPITTCSGPRGEETAFRGVGHSVGRSTWANWSPTGVNSGMTKSRRSQFAPSTTRV